MPTAGANAGGPETGHRAPQRGGRSILKEMEK
jgi:hypothetical protein